MRFWANVAGSSSGPMKDWLRIKHLKVQDGHRPQLNRESVDGVESKKITGLEKICMKDWTKIEAAVCANLLKTYRKCWNSVIGNQGKITEI